MRVLVVEDTHELRKLVVMAFGMLGIEAEGAADADEGIALGTSRPFDLALLDYMLPEDRTGAQVARAVLTQNPKTLAIFLSAYGGDLYRREATNSGGVLWIEKPLRFPAGYERVLALCRAWLALLADQNTNGEFTPAQVEVVLEANKAEVSPELVGALIQRLKVVAARDTG